jgi:hypothetical protein
VKWEKVCKAKKNGGLRFKDLRMINISLLCKWWWLLESGDRIWQDIVKLKYVKHSPTCSIPVRLQDSPIWKDLLKVRSIYLKGRGLKLNNGKLISFWKHSWLGYNPLCTIYPIMYDLCLDHNCSVADVANKGWVIDFKVRLHGIVREQWYCLAATLNNVRLNEDRDAPFWKWSNKKVFTVKSVYDHLSRGVVTPMCSRIWKSKLPEKIKKFMWLLE